MGAKTNIEILDNIKYPFCTDKDLFISDISGSHRLIKVSCLGENKWSFIVRKQKTFKLVTIILKIK